MTLNLRKLYHPGGLVVSDPESDCPCGCRHQDKDGPFTCEQLGIKGTPGMRAIAELRRKERAAKPKPVKIGSPWKGATVSRGLVTLPNLEDKCGDANCKEEHVLWKDGEECHRVHPKAFKAQIYTLGTAVARVRLDRKQIIKVR